MLKRCGPPVPPEDNGSRLTLIGEAPGADEVERGRPFVGKSGLFLGRVLQALGLSRRRANLTNTLLCRPPGNELKKVLAKVARIRKREESEGVPPQARTPYPQDCCRPRLQRELASTETAVPLGGFALKALYRNDALSILQHRGNLHEVQDGEDLRDFAPQLRKVLPTVHPAFVLRRRAFHRWFQEDIGRAFRWHDNRLNWVEPKISICTDPDQLIAWVRTVQAQRVPLIYDTETFVGDPRVTGLKCIGFGTADEAVVVPWLRCSWDGDGRRSYYSPYDQGTLDRMIEALRWIFTEPSILKAGWNSGYFDRMIIEQHFGVTPHPHVDGILMHNVVEPDMRHGLAQVAPSLIDVHAWKGDAQDHGWLRENEDLFHYCGIDCVVTARIIPLLWKAVAHRKQQRVLDRAHEVQAACVQLHYAGMPVDQQERGRLHAKFAAEAARYAQEARDILARIDPGAVAAARESVALLVLDEDDEEQAYTDATLTALDPTEFNPGSTQQVGHVLYERWQLPYANDLKATDLFTDSGMRSTGDAVLRAYLCDRRIPKDQRSFIQAVRMYRKKQKIVGTYLRPWRNEPGAKKPRCSLHHDGRLHSTWNAHVTSVGRLSSSADNVQNLPFVVKSAIAHEKDLIVQCDFDQLHLRIIANLWGIPSLIKAFEDGLDPHGLFAETVMGDNYRRAKGYRGYGIKPGKGLASDHRTTAKRLRFAGAYSAGVMTIFRVLLSAEHDGSDPKHPEGTLVNPGLTPAWVRALHQRWMKAEPEWEAAWARELATFKRQGYILSPILGRRQDFPDEKPTDIVNYPILSCEGDLMTGVTVQVAQQVRQRFRNVLYIDQVHDSNVLQADATEAVAAAAWLEDLMTVSVPGHRFPYTAEAFIGRHLGEEIPWKLVQKACTKLRTDDARYAIVRLEEVAKHRSMKMDKAVEYLEAA